MSKRKNTPEVDSDYADRVMDEYLAAKDNLDIAREQEYAAGISDVPGHGGMRYGEGAAAATAAAAAEAGLDMSAYVRDLNDGEESSMTASDEGLEAFMKSIGIESSDELTGEKIAEVASASSYFPETTPTTTQDEANELLDDLAYSWGPAVGMTSPLDGKFDLRTAHVGTALGEGTERPLLDLDGDYSALPSPEVLAAYPAEVQRKIIEWTDRDVRARRDNESLRQDILLRERIAQRKITMFFTVLIVVVCIVCAVATSLLLRDAIYAVVFLIIPLLVVAAVLVWLLGFGGAKK